MTFWFDDITVLLNNEWDPMDKDKVGQINIFTKLAILTSVVTIIQSGKSNSLNKTAYIVCISALAYTFGRFVCEKNEEHFTNTEKETVKRTCSNENPMGNKLIGEKVYNDCLPSTDPLVIGGKLPRDVSQTDLWKKQNWPFYKVVQPTHAQYLRSPNPTNNNQAICKEAGIFSHLGAPSYAYRSEACKPRQRTPLSNS